MAAAPAQTPTPDPAAASTTGGRTKTPSTVCGLLVSILGAACARGLVLNILPRGLQLLSVHSARLRVQPASAGITNLTNPIPQDETDYVSDSFTRFLEGLEGRPFVAQLAFHNCHIPFVGTAEQRQLCQNGTTCTESASSGPLADLTSTQLDFYACLNELDHAVGRVLDAMDANGYGHNTLTWLATDNGPEVNCEPEGFCEHSHYQKGPGSAVPLRGRKRDVFEGGHRASG